MKRLLLLLLCLLLASCLVSCDESGDVTDDFREAGYAVTELDLDEDEDLALLRKLLTDKDIAAIPDCDILVASKANIPLACVLAFDSRVDLRHYIETLDADKQEAASTEGRIRGNCYLRYASPSALEIYAED